MVTKTRRNALLTTTPTCARFTVANAALAIAHSAYELAGGVGLPGQKVFGLGGAVASHVALMAAWIGGSKRGSTRAGAVALLNGLGLAGALAHYVAWPIRWKGAFPVLQEGAEGLSPAWTRWYNGLLYAWGMAAAVAVLAETPPEGRRWALAGLGSVPLVAAASHRKHDWAREQGHLHPRWWNRALTPRAGAAVA